MEVIKSKFIPEGQDLVPYGNSYVSLPYMAGAEGIIELEATKEYMEGEEWRDEIARVIALEHASWYDFDEDHIITCTDYSWWPKPDSPGKFLIEYSL